MDQQRPMPVAPAGTPPGRRGFSLFSIFMVVAVAAILFGQVRSIVLNRDTRSGDVLDGEIVIAIVVFCCLLGAVIGFLISLQASPRKITTSLLAASAGGCTMPVAAVMLLIGLNVPLLMAGGTAVMVVMLVRYWRGD